MGLDKGLKEGIRRVATGIYASENLTPAGICVLGSMSTAAVRLLRSLPDLQ